MKVSVNWLKKFTAVDLSVDELVAKIGSQLGAVEEVIDLRGKYDGIRIVQITEAKPHPNADRLNVYQMTDGREQIQVVSGDRNLTVGDKVAWLAPGQTIPSTFGSDQPVMLDAREMRGQMSHGMFGSGKELELNDDNERVLVLDTDAAPGTLLADVYELDDVIIDIENKMFTHRPDGFGILGVAREIAGIQGKTFHSPDWYLLEAGKVLQAVVELSPVEIENHIPSLVPAYSVAVVRDVEIKPSPIQIQSYLKRVGIRPINNVVDVTNYLMYLTGQPLHAFDYDKVAAVDNSATPKIVVRHPHQDESLTLLDGRTITLQKDAMVIATRHKAIALGGVMGGADTEVDEQTRHIIIEAANFNMYAIRRTSMEHGIFTDAVTRFSKGQSAQQCGVVLAQAVELMSTWANGKLATELGVAQPQPALPIQTDTAFINERLGGQLHTATIKQLLANVEMDVHVHQDQLTIAPPFWRTDLEIAEDIVEEVGRLYGYNQLPHELPLRSAVAVSNPSIESLKHDVGVAMAMAGNNELQTYSFVAAKLLAKTGQDSKPAYQLRNALSPELELIRTSLLPSLLDKVHANHRAGHEQFGLFEIGKSHNKYDIGEDQLPRERLGLSYIFSADRKAAEAYQGASFYQAKRQLVQLFERLHIAAIEFTPLIDTALPEWWLQNLAALFEPKRSAVVIVAGLPLGIVGEFKSTIIKNFKLPAFVSGFELDLGILHGIHRPHSAYRPLVRFPSTEQDVCFKVATEVSYAAVERLIYNQFVADERLRVTVSPVDVYQREPAHKQITYRITLQHHDRTLTSEEVNQQIAELVAKAQHTFGAERL